MAEDDLTDLIDELEDSNFILQCQLDDLDDRITLLTDLLGQAVIIITAYERPESVEKDLLSHGEAKRWLVQAQIELG